MTYFGPNFERWQSNYKAAMQIDGEVSIAVAATRSGQSMKALMKERNIEDVKCKFGENIMPKCVGSIA